MGAAPRPLSPSLTNGPNFTDSPSTVNVLFLEPSPKFLIKLVQHEDNFWLESTTRQQTSPRFSRVLEKLSNSECVPPRNRVGAPEKHDMRRHGEEDMTGQNEYTQNPTTRIPNSKRYSKDKPDKCKSKQIAALHCTQLGQRCLRQTLCVDVCCLE